MAWFLSRPSNPTVVAVDTTVELTRETIERCPPAQAPQLIGDLLGISGIRSIDLHRYRARLNLVPGADLDEVSGAVSELLADEWGPASSKRDEPPRSYPVAYAGPRAVAESLRMAGSQPILRAVFSVRGVAEAVLEPGHVRVRLGRLFSWAEVEEDVREALGRSVASPPS